MFHPGKVFGEGGGGRSGKGRAKFFNSPEEVLPTVLIQLVNTKHGATFSERGSSYK